MAQKFIRNAAPAASILDLQQKLRGFGLKDNIQGDLSTAVHLLLPGLLSLLIDSPPHRPR